MSFSQAEVAMSPIARTAFKLVSAIKHDTAQLDSINVVITFSEQKVKPASSGDSIS